MQNHIKFKAWGWQVWDMLSSSVIKTATQTLRGLDSFFILHSSSLAGLSGPVYSMITALIKDGLGLCKSQDPLVNKENCQSVPWYILSVLFFSLSFSRVWCQVNVRQFYLYSPESHITVIPWALQSVQSTTWLLLCLWLEWGKTTGKKKKKKTYEKGKKWKKHQKEHIGGIPLSGQTDRQ